VDAYREILGWGRKSGRGGLHKCGRWASAIETLDGTGQSLTTNPVCAAFVTDQIASATGSVDTPIGGIHGQTRNSCSYNEHDSRRTVERRTVRRYGVVHNENVLGAKRLGDFVSQKLNGRRLGRECCEASNHTDT
jgi:hypothetical protein